MWPLEVFEEASARAVRRDVPRPPGRGLGAGVGTWHPLSLQLWQSHLYFFFVSPVPERRAQCC